MKKKLLLYLVTLLSLSNYAFAQDAAKEAEPTFAISGSVDTYVHTSMKNINTDFGTYAPTTSFANLRGFSLGMANLIASYAGEKAGFTADLVFGPRGSDAVFNSGGYGNLTGSGSGHIVNQLFAYYKLSDGVTLNMGQFNTFVGYEVISPTLNANYSCSYLFSNGPFNHTGIRADFSSESGLVGKLAIMNPTDFLEFNPVNTFTLGGQIGKTGDFGGVWLNVLYGDQDGKLDEDVDSVGVSSAGSLMQVDLTAGLNISETFYLGFNASYQSVADGKVVTGSGIESIGGDATSFTGFAVYPKLTLSDAFALALRAEYFSVSKGHVLASPIGTDAEGNGSVIEVTLSGNYKVGPLTIIPEVRIDQTSEDSFYKMGETEVNSMMTTLTLAAVYKF